ncbi:MAG: cation diffusion facilitator family transporter [Treponema sp.]|nr:cation diffusion facilitator family transporter [Treponema sp.]
MDKLKAQYTEGIVSIIVNTVLWLGKFWVGMLIGSIALIADSWHTLSDSISSVVIIIAGKLASKKSDKEHPFGHGRWELISSMFVSFLLGIVGYQFLMDSIDRFKSRESVIYGTNAIVIIAISIIIKELLAQYAFCIARKTDNTIVKADGWHHRSDALAAVVVLIGMIFSKYFWWMDSVLGMFCALVLFYVAFEIMKESVTKLLGEVPGQDLINGITDELNKMYKNDLRLHHVHLHNYISQKELTLHIRLNGNMTIIEGHKIATAIETMINEKFNMMSTIHLEPINESTPPPPSVLPFHAQ